MLLEVLCNVLCDVLFCYSRTILQPGLPAERRLPLEGASPDRPGARKKDKG